MRAVNFTLRPLALALSATLLAGCGGGSNDNTTGSSPPPPATPQRGQLLDNPPTQVGSYSPSDLLTLLGQNELGKTFLQLAYTPKCTVTVYHLTYETVDPQGNLTGASGALMVPSGSDSGCTGARPVVLYAHGTNTDRDFDIATLDPSSNAEGVLLAAVFAAEGYIVVAPNYLGYDTSTLGYHPFLIADPQSKDMTDALAAARSALPTAQVPNVSDGGKLFITGYSEGGYVALATQRAMQDAGTAVTASAPMSGPYALAAFGDAIFEGEVSASANVNLTLLTSAYQEAYANLYSQPTELYAPSYAGSIAGLLPSSTAVPDLESQGKLPAAVFDSTPPSSAYAAYTPATAPAALASVFASGFGSDYLIINDYRGAYLADALAHPDGGFPQLTDGLPPASPGNSLRVDLTANDLRGFVPVAPTLLCGGDSDPTVFFFNTTLVQQYWQAHPPATAPVVLDVDSAASSGDPYASLKAGFAAAKALVALDGGDAAVLAAYHATLVPPFCLSAVKSFFDAH